MTKNFDDIPMEDLNYFLLENMKKMIEERSEIRDNILFIPDYSLSIRPKVVRAEKNTSIIRYFLFCEDWDREIYETCVGVGNSRKNSLQNGEANFIYGLFKGLEYIFKKEYFSEITTVFFGKHRWKVYRSDIVGIGEPPKEEENDEFWDIVKNEIPNYLGNQKISYVKVFASKSGEDIACECRINDEPIKELGDLIAEKTKKWKVDSFSSKKQFFFLVQENETYTPYPYSDDELRKYILETSYTFDKCEIGEEYDRLIPVIGEKIGDYDLAEELITFIPEICAERAFPTINYPEKITIYFGEKLIKDFNKSQLASYYRIKRIVNEEIDKGNILNDLYHKYISVSSIYSVILRAKEDGVDLLEEGGNIALCYGFSEVYKMR